MSRELKFNDSDVSYVVSEFEFIADDDDITCLVKQGTLEVGYISKQNATLLFRDMDGKGKLMKPRRYVAPDFSEVEL